MLIEKSGLIYGFRPDLLIDFVIDPNGNYIKTVYNAKNQLVEVRHSSGQSLHIEYNAQERISRLSDQAGRETRYEYSQDGLHLIKVASPGGRVTSYAYRQEGSKDHRLLSITHPGGNRISYAYDACNRLASEEVDGARRLAYSYDIDGTTHIRDSAGGETTVKVNERGQPIEVRDPAGAVTRYGYNPNSKLDSIADPLNHTYQLAYDDLGNVVEIADPGGSRVRLTYEPALDKISSLWDGLGRVTKFSYDRLGNLVSIQYPDNSTEMFTYSEKGLQKSKTKRDGQVISYSFNDLGLLLSKRYPDGTGVDYSYDDFGRLRRASHISEETSFQYDSKDNLIGVTFGNRTLKYEYDEAGRRIRMSDPDGRVLSYEHDARGRLERIRDGNGRLAVEYQYDGAGRRTKKILGNGAYASYQYDAAGHLLRLVNYGPSGEEISHFFYTYDAAGNVRSKETAEGMEMYTYDALNQLTKVEGPDSRKVEYTYDPLGNRVKVTENGVPVAYTVTDLDQYTKVGSTTYKYDLNGNLIYKKDDSKPTYYEYDYEDRLVNVETPEDKVRYTYNPLGLRSSRTDSKGTARYLWDGDQVALEEDEAHRTVARYAWGADIDEAIMMERGGSSYYYAQDALQSVTDLMDATGKVLEHYRYSVFGEPLSDSSYNNTLLFTGASYDSAAALQYNRYRFYYPTLGRFITQDPKGLFGGINYYTYANNRATLSYDPYGLQSINSDLWTLRTEVTDEGMWDIFMFLVGQLPFIDPVGGLLIDLLPNPFGSDDQGYSDYGYSDYGRGSERYSSLSRVNSYNYPKYSMKYYAPFTYMHWREMTYLLKSSQESITIPKIPSSVIEKINAPKLKLDGSEALIGLNFVIWKCQ
jgi:RHS repeat-associated protein